MVLALGDRAREDRGIECRRRAHRQDRPVVYVHRHERPGKPERSERALRVGLQARVDRQPDVVSRLRGLAPQLARRATEGIDLHPIGPRLAPQETVVLVFDPGLPDGIPLAKARVAGLPQLLGGHLADVPEQVRRRRSLLVLAREDPLDAHAGEARPVLAQVVDLVHAEALLQDHRAARRRSVPLLQLLDDLLAGHPRHRGEPVELVASLGSRRRQVLWPDLDRQLGAVRHQDLAVPVEDVPPRRLDADLADAVVVRLGEVLVALKDLDVPEPEEQDGEDCDREPSEDRDPDREGRGAAFGLGFRSMQVHD